MAWLTRARALLQWVRASLWVIPALMTLAAVELAWVTIQLDMRLPADVKIDWWFVFGVGPDGVRGVLSALAGSIITVAGVVFSITVVALQLASTQYSPRVLRTFLEDRSTHVVLGTFIGTFVYALLVLRTVRAESESMREFVPSLSVTIAMLLGLVSVGALIFFIHDIAQSIRASVIVKRLTIDGRAIARRAFPREFGVPASAPNAPETETPGDADRWCVLSDRAGYLASVDDATLFELESHNGQGPVTVAMAVRVGEFIRSGDALAEVTAPRDADRERIDDRVRETFTLAAEPTGQQDVGLALSRLTDVCVRALSPGINDAATAGTCIDGLSEVLVTIGSCEPADTVRVSPEGTIRLVARYPDFAELVELALAPIRHHGCGDPAIALKLLDTIRSVGVRAHETRRAVYAREADLVWRAASQKITNADDLERVRARAATVLEALGGAGTHSGGGGRELKARRAS